MHKQALERIMASVKERKGINAIIGEPGLGKSTLIKTMISGLSSKVHYAWVFNTTLNAYELLKYICRDFGFNPKGRDQSDLIMELYSHLIEKYEQGKFCLLIIDEAQNLKPEVLEEIRQLSNLETARKKLLQVILSGQPMLDEILEHPQLHQLKQRICLKATLRRFNSIDTQNYIQHRMEIAGAKKDIFSKASLELVYEISDGIPRLINQVCENALIDGAENKIKEINSGLIRSLLEEGKVVTANQSEETEKSHLKIENYNNDNTKNGKSADRNSPELVNSGSESFDALDLGQLTIN
jgi:type II secretory pathway predicted ATPase ExeA